MWSQSTVVRRLEQQHQLAAFGAYMAFLNLASDGVSPLFHS